MQSPRESSFSGEQSVATCDRGSTQGKEGQMEAVQALANAIFHSLRCSLVVQRIGKSFCSILVFHKSHFLNFLLQSGDASIDINQIRSVKVSRGARNIPTCFEIFTGNQTLILKPTDGEKAEEWVQYLSIVVARHSQARDGFTKSNSLPSSGSRREINSRTAF